MSWINPLVLLDPDQKASWGILTPIFASAYAGERIHRSRSMPELETTREHSCEKIFNLEPEMGVETGKSLR
jgi:hypothetical protein